MFGLNRVYLTYQAVGPEAESDLARILSAWFDGRFSMVVTPRILEEYELRRLTYEPAPGETRHRRRE